VVPVTVPVLTRTQSWYCPNCTAEHVSTGPVPHVIFHTCKGLRGLNAPFLPKGTKAKVEAVERGDYVGNERVQVDPQHKRPIQSIVTTRDNGQDTVVLAPSATLRGDT
jgi:hypothetical protein